MVEFNQQLLVDSLKAEYQQQDIPFSLHIFSTLSSTNQTLWQLIDQGEKPGCVVIATEQTAGRGQWGRQWQSLAGGLYLSMVIDSQLLSTYFGQCLGNYSTITKIWYTGGHKVAK